MGNDVARKTGRMQKTRHRSGLVAVALALVALVGVGCDRRASEIKSRLDAEQLAIFERGQKLSTECWACHDFYTTTNRIGPYLLGVFGRRAGDAGGFPYSIALAKSEIRWDEDSLRRYISAPNGFIPGTTMVSRGVPAGPSLEALMFYMRHVTADE
jgi:cytochrome c